MGKKKESDITINIYNFIIFNFESVSKLINDFLYPAPEPQTNYVMYTAVAVVLGVTLLVIYHYWSEFFKSTSKYLTCVVAHPIELNRSAMIKLSPACLDKLKLCRGDTVLIRGCNIRNKASVCRVFPLNMGIEKKVIISSGLCKNIDVQPGDLVEISRSLSMQYAKIIHLSLIGMEFDSRNIYEELRSHLLYQPVHGNDTIILNSTDNRDFIFKIMEMNPAPYCLISPTTVFYIDGEPLHSIHEKNILPELGMFIQNRRSPVAKKKKDWNSSDRDEEFDQHQEVSTLKKSDTTVVLDLNNNGLWKEYPINKECLKQTSAKSRKHDNHTVLHTNLMQEIKEGIKLRKLTKPVSEASKPMDPFLSALKKQCEKVLAYNRDEESKSLDD